MITSKPGRVRVNKNRSRKYESTDFYGDYKFICIYCGEEIIIPNHKTETKDGWGWMCKACRVRKNKICNDIGDKK